jgi:hypothetical protein
MDEMVPVVFNNAEGVRLFGIIHEPKGDRQKSVGVIIINPGIKNRVAPHRLNVKLANQISALGYLVLRFDPQGVGDSEGNIKEERTADFYASIQHGLFVEDTICAMDWMSDKYGYNKFVLGGLCGAAITGLLVGWKDQRVRGLLSLGIPVLIERGADDYFKIMSKGQIQHHYEGYKTKLFSPRAWIRLLTFQSNYYVIFKSVMNRILPRERTGRSRKDQNENEALNKSFMPAIKSFVSSKRMIFFIFSEKDRLCWEFEEKIFLPYQRYFESARGLIEIYVEKNANHVLSLEEWQESAFKKLKQWLLMNFNY